MHEVSLAMNIIDCLSELIKSHQMRTIEKVTVQIGELSNVMPEALRFAFESMIRSKASSSYEITTDNPFENCQMIIERLTASAICIQCKQLNQVTHEQKRCRYCGSSQLEMRSGYELQISEIEGEEVNDQSAN